MIYQQEFFYILFLLAIPSLNRGLICNGDFQSTITEIPYMNSQNNTDLKSAFLFDQPTCWQIRTDGSFIYEVKQIVDPQDSSINKVMDFLFVGKHIKLCQTVSLIEGKNYKLQFKFILDSYQTSAQITVFLNSNIIFTDVVRKVDAYRRFQLQFITNVQQNQICFLGSNQNFTRLASSYQVSQYGSMLDDVLLYEYNVTVITNTTKNVTVKVECGINKIKFRFITDLNTIQSQISISDLNALSIQIQSQAVTQDGISISINDQKYVEISLTTTRYYPLQSVLNSKFTLPSISRGNDNLKLNFQIDHSKISYYDLSPIQNQIVEIVDSSASSFAQKIYSVYIVMNAASCSAFILGLIGFYNLSLMYVFLHIDLVPSFANNFMYNLVHVFYKRNSTTAILNNLFKKSQSQNLLQFKHITATQKIPNTKNGQKWYNYFGMSSNFLINNMQSLILTTFYLLKYVIFRIIVNILPNKIGAVINLTYFEMYSLFLIQFSCFMPFFIVSTGHVLTYLGQCSFKGIINNIMHITSFTVIIFAPLIQLVINMFYISKYRLKNSPKYLKYLRKLPQHYLISLQNLTPQQKKLKQKINRTQCIYYNYSQTFETYISYIFCILIPICIVFFNNIVCFFVFTTPIIAFRLSNAIRNCRLYNLFEKIIKLGRAILWGVYQTNFILLAFLGHFNPKDQQKSQKILGFMKFSGFTIIICLILGALIDLLKTFFLILQILKKGIAFLIKKIKSIQQEKRINSLKTLQTIQLQKHDQQQTQSNKDNGDKSEQKKKQYQFLSKIANRKTLIKFHPQSEKPDDQSQKTKSILKKTKARSIKQKIVKFDKVKTNRQILQQFKMRHIDKIMNAKEKAVESLKFIQKNN